MVKGIGFVIGIVLARLIAPEIYGLLAIVTVFISLAQTFVLSGLATALVQNQETKEEDYSTVFFLSMAIAAGAVVFLYFFAPIVAKIYENDIVVWPLRVLSLTLLIGAFDSVQTAKMQREMRFKEMMVCNLIATVVSGAAGIYAAIKGLGLWALVIYQMVQVVTVAIAVFIAGKWLPTCTFSIKRAKILYGYGWKLLVSALLTSFYSEIRLLIVGYKYTSADLAYYNKGYQFPNIIANTLDVSIQSVMLPVMSREQEKSELLREMLKRTLSLSVFAVTPVLLGLAAIAETLIPVLLGEIWKPCIPLLCVFCVSEIMLPIKSSNLCLLKAIGRSDLYMKTELVRRIIMIGILAASLICFDSVLVIAIGYAVSAWIDTFIIAAAVNTQIKYSWIQQACTVWKSLFCGLMMYAIVYFMNSIAINPIMLLMLQIVVGVGVYIVLSVISKNPAFSYIFRKLRTK